MSVIDPDSGVAPGVLAAATAFETQARASAASCSVHSCNACRAQVEVFSVLMADDTAEAVFDTTSLCEPEALFSAVLHTAVENGAFRNILGVLQRLLLIPAEWGYGRGAWQEVENAVHRCVALRAAPWSCVTRSRLSALHRPPPCLSRAQHCRRSEPDERDGRHQHRRNQAAGGSECPYFGAFSLASRSRRAIPRWSQLRCGPGTESATTRDREAAAGDACRGVSRAGGRAGYQC